MIWLLTLPIRLAFKSTKVATKTGYRTGRLFGYRRLFVFGAGVAVGLAVAPVTGNELRAAVRRRLESRGLTDADLSEKVRFELAHNPRTWHLPQPDVSVAERRVTLRGQVPDDGSRVEMVRAAGALAGVTGVDDQLTVAAAAGV